MFKQLFLSLSLLVVPVVSATDLAKVISIESVKQYEELKKGSLVTMFTASWCGPCKQIKPSYIEFSAEYPGVTFCMIDIDKEELRAIDPSVKSVPTFVYTHQGKELEKVVGIGSRAKLQEFIEKNQTLAAGKEYKAKAVEFLSAEEYYTIGVEWGKQLVAKCQEKDLKTADFFGLSASPNQSVVALGESLTISDATIAKKAWELYLSYNRGMKEGLKAYKPHQQPQDSFIKVGIYTIEFVLTAPDFKAYQQWSIELSKKYSEKQMENMYQIFAEILSSK